MPPPVESSSHWFEFLFILALLLAIGIGTALNEPEEEPIEEIPLPPPPPVPAYVEARPAKELTDEDDFYVTEQSIRETALKSALMDLKKEGEQLAEQRRAAELTAQERQNRLNKLALELKEKYPWR